MGGYITLMMEPNGFNKFKKIIFRIRLNSFRVKINNLFIFLDSF